MLLRRRPSPELGVVELSWRPAIGCMGFGIPGLRLRVFLSRASGLGFRV